MRIFLIRNDTNSYRYFLPENEADALAFAFDGTPKAQQWSPPEVRIVEPKLKVGNFYNFDGGCLIADPDATKVLRTAFEHAGELLPLAYKGKTYSVLNVTQCVDCLDGEQTTWRIPAVQVERYAFKADRFSLSSPIFKIPEERHTAIFVVEGLMETERELRDIVRRQGLKGLVFHEIWSSERGGTLWDERTDLFSPPAGGLPF